MLRMLATFFLQLRVFGSENIPKDGAVLIVANHQSYLDPPMIGICSPRRMNYLARKTLFKAKSFASLILSYDAIPIDNEGIGLEGIKETLKRLKNREMVLLFPEGARTFDGEMLPFKSGFLTLALRSKATILPVAISGMYEAWPRTAAWPRLHPTRVHFGEAISYEKAAEIAKVSESDLHEHVQNTIRNMYENLRKQK